MDQSSLKKRKTGDNHPVKIEDSHSPPVAFGDSDTMPALGLGDPDTASGFGLTMEDDHFVGLGDPATMSSFGVPMLNVKDSLKLFERFTREQLVDVIQTALLTNVGVLDAVRLVADRDPAQRKLFICGLNWETTTQDRLNTFFSQYGELEEAAVVLDKATGKSKGFGFVTFKHADGAINALKEPRKLIDNRVTLVKYASAGVSGGSATSGNVNNPESISLRKIYVNNVPLDMSADRLLSCFSMYGEIEKGPLGYDYVTGKSKGFALFVYKSAEAAKAAVAEPVKNIDGFSVNCKFADTYGGQKGKPGGGQIVNETHADALGVGMGAFPCGNPSNTEPGGGSVKNPVNIPSREIYVGNVPPDMPPERLLSRFSMYGEIEEGPLGFDHVTGKSKGFALFVYKSAEAARASVAEPIKNIDGFPLNCKFANAVGLEGKPGWARTGCPQVSGNAGAGGGNQSVGGMRPGFGSQSGGGSLASGSGDGSAFGVGYGNGGVSSGGYAGTGNTDSGSGAGLGVTGGGIHMTGDYPQSAQHKGIT